MNKIYTIEDLKFYSLVTFVSCKGSVFPVKYYNGQEMEYDSLLYRTICDHTIYSKFINCLFKIDDIVYRLSNERECEGSKILSFEPI